MRTKFLDRLSDKEIFELIRKTTYIKETDFVITYRETLIFVQTSSFSFKFDDFYFYTKDFRVNFNNWYRVMYRKFGDEYAVAFFKDNFRIDE